MVRLIRNAHCSYCGVRYPDGLAWPRTCAGCGSISYLNPLPVGVCLLPVDDGLLCVRRGIEPALGQIALPGGFLDVGETWQEGCVRELREETGIDIPASEVKLFQALSVPTGFLLLFGLLQPRRAEELPPFVPCEEVLETLVVREAINLAFPMHTQAMREYFSLREAAR
jgi:NADH pyrophosphatase NudC (nudix superfamily)